MLPLALILVLPGIALILLKRRWLLPVIFSLIAFAAGLYCYAMHRTLTLERAQSLDGETLRAEAVILAVPEAGDGWMRAELRLYTEGRGSLKGLYYDHEGLLADARPGDSMVGEFRLRSTDTRYGEAYDNDLARGLYLTLSAKEPPTLLHTGRFTLRGLASTLNAALCGRIRELFPADTASFFSALLLGEKSDLYGDDAMHLHMSRAGLMHTVAVSGMHVAYLVGMLRSLLGNTRKMALPALVLVWFFVLLTGASPSAVRAALMQTTVLLAPVFDREEDPPTSLLFALALILLVNPFAAASVSLQLSFSAMAGILLFAEPLRKGLTEGFLKRLPFRLRSHLCSNLANSLAVPVFSTPLIGVYFGYVSVLAPLTNLLCLWAIPCCFLGGYAVCLLSLLSFPAAGVAARVLSLLARWILLVAEAGSSLGFSCLYLCLKANILWLLLVYILFVVAFILWRRGWMRWVFPTGLAVLSLFVLLTATRLYYGALPGMMTAVDVGQGQSLVVFAQDRTLVVDCGNINSRSNAGDLTGAYLCSRGREKIDCLILTHLHTDHADGVLRLLEYMPVDQILIGSELEDPNSLLPELQAAAARHGTRLRVVGKDETLRFGAIRAELFAPGSAGNINERCLSARIGVGGFELLTTGDMNAQAERELLETHNLSGTELLIVGHHGSKTACSEELLRSLGARRAVISCGFNTFGHPTEETLERLRQFGYTVYRTDEAGTVEIRVPEVQHG